eukprot:TRINITY_DN9363_c0_g1_i2.p2 TRINITY_DN9363_c0_g1~~TRINITY_DN9363_c0_g1_i2.p2  ORF type:complete len:149 (-),score=30.47 TRINITY_DN9363_c0_g1_i2:44-490(-)
MSQGFPPVKAIKDLHARRWEKRWLSIGPFKVLKWVPAEARNLQNIQHLIKAAEKPPPVVPPRYTRANAPITRSVAATLDKEYRKSKATVAPKVTTRGANKKQKQQASEQVVSESNSNSPKYGQKRGFENVDEGIVPPSKIQKSDDSNP